MKFEDYLQEINLKIKYFCYKYNIFNIENDLLGEAFLCFEKCKRKYRGKPESFKYYFLKSLENHFKRIVYKEMKYLNMDEGKLELFSPEPSTNIQKVNIEEFLTPLQLEIFGMKEAGFTLKEISKIKNIPYEKLKDEWSLIKKKIKERGGEKYLSRKETRKIWREMHIEYVKKCIERWLEKNPYYYKEWRKKNTKYFKEYMRKYRNFDKNKIKKVLEEIISCKNNYDFNCVKEKNALKFCCKKGGCEYLFTLGEFFKGIDKTQYDYILILKRFKWVKRENIIKIEDINLSEIKETDKIILIKERFC